MRFHDETWLVRMMRWFKAFAVHVINLKHIEVFHAIMRTHSVTAAARMLNVTQPAISAVLKHLENRVQMKLFERSGGRLQPTPEAEALMPDVAGIFSRIGSIERMTRDLAGGRLGSLSIAASSPIANGRLAGLVAQFVGERPQVRVALQAIASPLVLDRVANREVGIGIAFAPVAHSEVVTEVLGRNGLGCVLREDHPLAARPEISAHDLAPYPLITYLPQTLLRPYVDRAFADAGVTPTIAIEVGQSATGISLVRRGAGIALVESELLTAQPLAGLVLRPVFPAIQFETLLLQHKSAPRSQLQREFTERLKHAFMPA